jgi:hypothetical protein
MPALLSRASKSNRRRDAYLYLISKIHPSRENGPRASVPCISSAGSIAGICGGFREPRGHEGKLRPGVARIATRIGAEVLKVAEHRMARLVRLKRAAVNDFLQQLDWITVAHDRSPPMRTFREQM